MKKSGAGGIFRRRIGGFTMLEVMVSVVIISAVALGVMGTVLYTKRASSITQQRMIAIQLIDKKLNEVKSDGTRALVLNAAGSVFPEIKDPESKKFLRNISMQIAVTALKPSDPTLKKIVATVGWDYPWTTKTSAQACNLENSVTCDKQESVVTLLFEE